MGEVQYKWANSSSTSEENLQIKPQVRKTVSSKISISFRCTKVTHAKVIAKFKVVYLRKK